MRAQGFFLFYLICFFVFLIWTWVIQCGVLFLPPIQALFRPPLERACYHDPIPNLLLSSPLLFFLILLLLSCSGHRLASSSPLPSNNVCIHVPKETPTDPQTHSHTHTNTFCGLPQSEALKRICLALYSTRKNDFCPAGGLCWSAIHPVCTSLLKDNRAECPTATLSWIRWPWGEPEAEWVADGCRWSGSCCHMSKQERLLQNCHFRLFQRWKKSKDFFLNICKIIDQISQILLKKMLNNCGSKPFHWCFR